MKGFRCPHCHQVIRLADAVKGGHMNQRGPATLVPPSDYPAIADRYRAGETLGDIGASYGVTRERIRQILKSLGLDSHNGGLQVRRAEAAELQTKQRAEFEVNRDRRCKQRTGCNTWAEYVRLKKIKVGGRGCWWAFTARRSAAKRDGHTWSLLFADWLKVWLDSGHADEQGRGNAYHMTRRDETKPWQKGNVRIVYGPDFQAEMRERDRKRGAGIYA